MTVLLYSYFLFIINLIIMGSLEITSRLEEIDELKGAISCLRGKLGREIYPVGLDEAGSGEVYEHVATVRERIEALEMRLDILNEQIIDEDLSSVDFEGMDLDSFSDLIEFYLLAGQVDTVRVQGERLERIFKRRLIEYLKGSRVRSLASMEEEDIMISLEDGRLRVVVEYAGSENKTNLMEWGRGGTIGFLRCILKKYTS